MDKRFGVAAKLLLAFSETSLSNSQNPHVPVRYKFKCLTHFVGNLPAPCTIDNAIDSRHYCRVKRDFKDHSTQLPLPGPV